MEDRYKTIKEPTTGDYREKGSKFLAYAFPVFSEADWEARLEEVRKAHPKARHVCFAFRLGLDGNTFRANDAGEPAGTAGRPVLGQIDSFGLTNLLVVVVRYFGGVKLGVPGLTHAYRTSAADALQKAEYIEKTVEDVYGLSFDYALMTRVMNAVKKLGLEIVRQDFTDQGRIEIAIRKSETPDTLKQLKAQIAQVHLEEEEKWQEIPGLKIGFLYTR